MLPLPRLPLLLQRQTAASTSVPTPAAFALPTACRRWPLPLRDPAAQATFLEFIQTLSKSPNIRSISDAQSEIVFRSVDKALTPSRMALPGVTGGVSELPRLSDSQGGLCCHGFRVRSKPAWGVIRAAWCALLSTTPLPTVACWSALRAATLCTCAPAAGLRSGGTHALHESRFLSGRFTESHAVAFSVGVPVVLHVRSTI